MDDRRDKASITVGTTTFTSLLTVLFIGLKLAGIIKWSWIWVLSPIWITWILIIVIVIIGILIYTVWRRFKQ